jgi:hypothetical protein
MKKKLMTKMVMKKENDNSTVTAVQRLGGKPSSGAK